MDNQDTRIQYPRVLLKTFIIKNESGEKIITKSFLKAQKSLNKGWEVKAFVHIKNHGQWKTGKILEITNLLFKRIIKTEGYIYNITGYEPTKHVERVIFQFEGSDCLNARAALDEGREIRAEVFLENGYSYVTSRVTNLNTDRKSFTTETYSRYRW